MRIRVTLMKEIYHLILNKLLFELNESYLLPALVEARPQGVAGWLAPPHGWRGSASQV